MEAIVFWGALGVLLLAYMSLWYGISLYTKRYDVVDTAWGLGFVFVTWLSLAIAQNFTFLSIFSAILTSMWGLRLAAHIANRNWCKTEDDHRYQAMRSKWGTMADQKAFTRIFLLQGALILAIATPLIAIARTTTATVNGGVITGWVLWLLAICFEAIADYQLSQFIKRRPAGSHTLMTQGLWQYSRHPNYFGEICAWWGAAIVSLSVGQWWGVVGAVVITALITKVSGIPPFERHYANNKAYQMYAHKTSVLVPLPPKV